jgi:hypothetical protein
MAARNEDMVSIPRAELDALRLRTRRLRREAGDAEALRGIRSDSGEGRTFIQRAGLSRREAFPANGCAPASDARLPERRDHVVGG